MDKPSNAGVGSLCAVTTAATPAPVETTLPRATIGGGGDAIDRIAAAAPTTRASAAAGVPGTAASSVGMSAVPRAAGREQKRGSGAGDKKKKGKRQPDGGGGKALPVVASAPKDTSSTVSANPGSGDLGMPGGAAGKTPATVTGAAGEVKVTPGTRTSGGRGREEVGFCSFGSFCVLIFLLFVRNSLPYARLCAGVIP